MTETRSVRLAWVVIAAVGLSACSAVTYNPTGVPHGAAPSVSTEDIRAAVLRAGARRGWAMKDMGGNVIRASYAPRTHEAVVDISYDTRAFSITHVSSVGLGESNGYINRHYNRWVRNLERDIVFEVGNPERKREWVEDYKEQTKGRTYGPAGRRGQ